jgi:Pyridoxamine 5'-phosphate oxidase
MTALLPAQLLEVFERSISAEYVTIDARGQPVAWPLAPSYHAREGCIDVAIGARDHAQAADSIANPHVALLFSDPTGLDAPPMVLVQGTAQVGADRIHVRPERIYVWPGADPDAEPLLYDAHVEEVRSAHNEEPEIGHAPPEGGRPEWDDRLDELGYVQRMAVLAFVGPDGFPFAVRVPVLADRAAGTVRIESDPLGAPMEAGLACLCAQEGRCFLVRGDLEEDRGGWILRPHRVVGASERPAEQASPGR